MDAPTTSLSVTKTYSLTLDHIAKINHMASIEGVPQAEILRQAIDALYAAKFSPTASPTQAA